jgi:tight adherence protein B
MSREISFGLELETVFERFSERIKLEEAVYLTSSLSILNKTGGNIIKVFDSIEKTLYNRKKLNLEMRSLTGSSRIIMYTLMIVPIAFVLFITLINPTYFNPLFTSPIGFIIMGIVLLLYITYIYVVKKIMTIRM